MDENEIVAEAQAGSPRGRRGARVVHGTRSALPPQRPFRQPVRRYAPVEAVSADALEAIHLTSLQILEEVGMDVLEPTAREMFAAAGATVKPGEGRVHFDREMILETIKTAPSEFTLHSWNPERNLRIGGNNVAFCSVGSPPNVAGRGKPRHSGTRTDYQDLIRLAHMLNSVHLLGGYPVEPMDVHASVRHLDATFDALVLTDKVLHAYSLGPQRNQDALELIRLARGVSHETLNEQPSVFTVINSSSPLRLDIPMLQGIMEYSARNQVVVMTPFTLAGAMAPITVAGAVAQQNAEALVGMAFTQIVRKGSPVVYGGFTSNVDMQSGAPAFGTPEYMKSAMLGGQLARRYGVPYRSSNVNAANALDAQAAYESVFALWGAIMGGVNFLMHGAGWMEGGLHASFEKMVLDAELLGMVENFLDPLVVDEDSLAMEAIRDVGPGGHYFGTAHTQSRFRTEFHRPMLSDWRNYESWEEAGSPQVPEKAARLVETFLGAYEAPGLPDDRRAAMEEFVARRKAEGGVPTDY